jgi:2-oxoisovalerate dehydrogenase E1 component alpha subunit
MPESSLRVNEPPADELTDPADSPASVERPQWTVPGAPHRPGEEPRFPRFRQQPGDFERPDPLAPARELRPHATGLVRVLSDDGSRASGQWRPDLEPAALRRGLEAMLRVRVLDDRLIKMQRQGRLSFYLLSLGEEAVSVAAALAYSPEDLLFPTYRMVGLFLVRGMPMLDIMCQNIGNGRDIAKGRQMPVHYSWRAGNCVSVSSPVGTQYPQAVGAAMAAAYRGERQVVGAWIGDGTTAQGDFHYGLNFASVYLPPVVLQVVNNQWAISTHRHMAGGGATFAARAEGYGLPGIRVDGNDFLAVYAVTAWAVERARRGGGPTLIELLTYRCGAHSTSDDPSLYRSEDEARCWPGGDPIERLASYLKSVGAWSDAEQQRLVEKLEGDVAATFKQAESYGRHTQYRLHTPEPLFDDVYRERPPAIERQIAEWGAGHGQAHQSG